ncbi:MAG: hypothetical protein KJO18_01500, partial [Acidimicrobiia bacterium]|nr:hypothetical protein [Acidimicrobiia bacterium]
PEATSCRVGAALDQQDFAIFVSDEHGGSHAGVAEMDEIAIGTRHPDTATNTSRSEPGRTARTERELARPLVGVRFSH